jgi:hypothetical protein
MAFGDQFVGDADPVLGRSVLSNHGANPFKGSLIGFQDNDAILDTSDKISAVGQPHLGTQSSRKNQPAILCHLHM